MKNDPFFKIAVEEALLDLNKPKVEFLFAHSNIGFTPEQLKYVKEQIVSNADNGFFIKKITIPFELGSVPNALYGPAAGDPPIKEEDVFYKKRGLRGWEDRMIDLPPRPTQVAHAIGERDGNKIKLYTVYGGPLAPRNPDDPDNPDIEQSKVWWSEHALSAQHQRLYSIKKELEDIFD